MANHLTQNIPPDLTCGLRKQIAAIPFSRCHIDNIFTARQRPGQKTAGKVLHLDFHIRGGRRDKTLSCRIRFIFP